MAHGKHSSIDRAALIQAARRAAALARAPYSNYRVGAAVLSDAGLFPGANIENASANLGLCAERVALSCAVMGGATRILAVAVVCIDARRSVDGTILDPGETMPCGGCRQWLSELAPEALVFTESRTKGIRVADLLPDPFRLGARD